MSNRILDKRERQLETATMIFLIPFTLIIGLEVIISEPEENIKTNKEILKSKLDSIVKRDVQKSADTLDIDGYRLIVKKVIKNQNQR